MATLEGENSQVTLAEIKKIPKVGELEETIHKKSALVEIIGEQHTTQAFKTAEDMRRAFAGQLERMPDSIVNPLVEDAHTNFEDLIKENNITDDDLRRVFEKVWIYSRLTTPVHEELEEVISLMEHTEKSAVFGSGLAALSATIEQFTNGSETNLVEFLTESMIEITKKNGVTDEKLERYIESLKFHSADELSRFYLKAYYDKTEAAYDILNNLKGDKIVVIGAVYGGSFARMKHSFKKSGRKIVHLPISKFEKNGLPEDTSMVFFEACNNPTLKIAPIKDIVDNAKKLSEKNNKKINVVCDNTFTPISVNPIDLGVDLVTHSMTKSLSGNSDSLGGVISGKADQITKLNSLESGERMLSGGGMDPLVIKQFLNNLKDLVERIYHYSNNSQKLKNAAESFGFPTNSANSSEIWEDIKSSNLPEEFNNGMVTIDFGTAEKAEEFVDAMSSMGVGKLAVSLGAKTTYYCIPAQTTHSEMDSEEQLKAGITPGLVRISCGIEDNLVEKVLEVFKK